MGRFLIGVVGEEPFAEEAGLVFGVDIEGEDVSGGFVDVEGFRGGLEAVVPGAGAGGKDDAVFAGEDEADREGDAGFLLAEGGHFVVKELENVDGDEGVAAGAGACHAAAGVVGEEAFDEQGVGQEGAADRLPGCRGEEGAAGAGDLKHGGVEDEGVGGEASGLGKEGGEASAHGVCEHDDPVATGAEEGGFAGDVVLPVGGAEAALGVGGLAPAGKAESPYGGTVGGEGGGESFPHMGSVAKAVHQEVTGAAVPEFVGAGKVEHPIRAPGDAPLPQGVAAFKGRAGTEGERDGGKRKEDEAAALSDVVHAVSLHYDNKIVNLNCMSACWLR